CDPLGSQLRTVLREPDSPMIDALNEIRARVAAVNKELLGAGIGIVEQQDTAGGSLVAPCAADFLIVLLYRAGDMVMHNEPDVRFVDPHSKGIGCDDGLGSPFHESVLSPIPLIIRHTAVIDLGGLACHLEPRGNLLGRFSGCCVHDSRPYRSGNDGFQDLEFVLFTRDVDYAERQIRPIESGYEDTGFG